MLFLKQWDLWFQMFSVLKRLGVGHELYGQQRKNMTVKSQLFINDNSKITSLIWPT